MGITLKITIDYEEVKSDDVMMVKVEAAEWYQGLLRWRLKFAIASNMLR
jgi:hypothetical protein